MGNHVLVGLHRFLHRTAVTVAVMGFLTPAVRAESLAYLFNHPWPTNDDFADAIEIIGTNAVVYGHNVGATVQEGEPYHRGVPNDEDGSESVWWRWTAPSDGLLSLSTAGSSFDTFLAVYTGAELEGLEQVARGKSAGRADWSQARVPVLAGTTYQIAVARDFFWGTGKVRLALEFGPSPGPPQNDAFANATELFVSNQTFVASLGGATLEPHEYRNPIAAFEVASAWWRWTPPTNGVLTLLTVEATGEFDWALYSGTSETGLIEIARAYTDHGFAVPVSAGTEYRLAATDGTPWPADTEVELRFSPGGGSPSNDPFYGAIPLTGTNVEISGDFFGSTLELGEQAHPDSEDGVCSLWYSWTPPSDGFASIRLLDGLAGFAIYAGASVSNLSSVAGLGDPEDLADGLVFPVFATTNYLIAAIGESQTHAFRSRVTHQPATIPPENDNFDAATLIPGVSLQEWRHNGGATQESGEPTHRYDGERSVWWRWTAPSDGIAAVAVVSNSMDVGLAVYSGSSLWQLASTGVAGAGADDFDSEPARVTFRANAGTTYRIAVAGDDGEEGVFGLELDFRDDITVPPANDAIANAIQIVGNDAEIFAHNVGATKQSGEPNPTDDGAAQSSVWWWWVAPADGFVTLSTDGSTFRAGLAVYAGASVTSANRQSSDSGSGPGGSAVLTTRVVGGQQYRIVVDGEEGQGFLRLALYFTEGVPISPPNDDFDVAFNLHGEDIATWGTTAGATRETGEPLHGGEWADARDSIWWRWTAPSNGILRLSVQGEELKPLLAIYTGSNLASLLGVASGYDDDLGTELRRTIQVVAGREYRICVAGYDETASVIRLGLAFDADLATPPNDAFADAAILSENTAEVFGSTFGATMEPGETNHIDQLWTGSSRSLWWTWTATADGFLSITVNGWATQPQLAAYTGDSVTNLNRLATLPYSWVPLPDDVVFPVTAGTEYHIAVAGGSPDWFRLSAHYIDPGPPANDDFENAVPLGGAQTNAWGSCTGATAESGEPYFGDDTNSVWWAWTAPADGQLMVDCLDGSVRVNALVLSGDALSNLVYEPFEILDWRTGTLLGQVFAGHQYYIRVASYGRGGSVRLALGFFPESLYDFWSTQTFPGNAPAELRQPGADPDADGRPNGVELALGTDPMFGNWGGVPTLKNDVGIASVTFARSAMLAEGVTLMLEHSTTLQPDSWSAVATYLPATGWHADLAGAMVQETGSGDVKQVEVFLPQTLANQSRSFYRIRTDQR